jgi:hypothetical protein
VAVEKEARRALDDAEALTCVSMEALESRAQDLQALVFRALRHTRELLRERKVQQEHHALVVSRIVSAKELRGKNERHRRQQMHEMKQLQGVVAFAARTLFDQLSLMGAEMGIVVESLICAAQQERKYVENAFEREREREMEREREREAERERERSMGRELLDSQQGCEVLSVQLAHAAAKAREAGDKCLALEVYVYLSVYVYTHKYTRTHIHAYIHTYMHACMHTYIHT